VTTSLYCRFEWGILPETENEKNSIGLFSAVFLIIVDTVNVNGQSATIEKHWYQARNINPMG
jgi:hypothetical protein